MKFKEFRCQPVWSKARQICVRDDNEEFGTFSPKDDLSWLDEYPVIDSNLDSESRILFVKVAMFKEVK